jgi:hypothetical protein
MGISLPLSIDPVALIPTQPQYGFVPARIVDHWLAAVDDDSL